MNIVHEGERMIPIERFRFYQVYVDEANNFVKISGENSKLYKQQLVLKHRCDSWLTILAWLTKWLINCLSWLIFFCCWLIIF